MPWIIQRVNRLTDIQAECRLSAALSGDPLQALDTLLCRDPEGLRAVVHEVWSAREGARKVILSSFYKLQWKKMLLTCATISMRDIPEERRRQIDRSELGT